MAKGPVYPTQLYEIEPSLTLHYTGKVISLVYCCVAG